MAIKKKTKKEAGVKEIKEIKEVKEVKVKEMKEMKEPAVASAVAKAMPDKKAKADKEEQKSEVKSEKYFYAVGRRKASVAQVRIYPFTKEECEIEVNKKEFMIYFPTLTLQNNIMAPLRLTPAKFKITALIKGGGFNGQSEAFRLGISRAMVLFDESLKKSLKDNGFLTRDSRVVERKKPGLKKARRAPQWQKR
jgi:small subunit ribosomal protein S9